MGRACSAFGGDERVLVGKPEEKRQLRRPRRRWEDNINPFVTSGTCNSHLQRVFFKYAVVTVSHFFSMLPSTLKYFCFVEPGRMHFTAKQPYCTNDTVCNTA
jgi:hypothetical protein